MTHEFSTETAWVPTSAAVADLGVVHVHVDQVDVTYGTTSDDPDGRPWVAVLESFGSTDPFGDDVATVVFPGISGFDELGSAASGDDNSDLSMFYDGAEVDLVVVDPDTGTEVDLYGAGTGGNLFEGLIDGWELTQSEDGNDGLRLFVLGAVRQVGEYVRAPTFTFPPVQMQVLIDLQWSHDARPHLRTLPLTVEGDPSQFLTQYTGAWEDPLTYVEDLLTEMVDASGNAWTVQHDRGRQPVLRVRDLTTEHHVVSYGQPGFASTLRREFGSTLNTLYGEGEDDAGARWRNATILSTAGGTSTSYQPIANDPAVHPVTGNPSFDVDARRREHFATFPSGLSLTEAQQIGQRWVDVQKQAGWTGTITLRGDPEAGSRFAIRAGDNLLVRYFDGSGFDGTLFHVVEAQHDLRTLTSTLTVDTEGRSRSQLEALVGRLRTRNLARRPRIGTANDTVQDRKQPWDDNSGYLPNGFATSDTDVVTMTNNQYEIFGINVPEQAFVRRTEFRLYVVGDLNTLAAQPFHISFYDSPVVAGDLPPDPFAAGAWDETPEGGTPAPWEDRLVRIYGVAGDRAGYWPGNEPNGDPATGVLIDDTDWSFTLAEKGNVTLWVAAYTNAGSVWGQGRLFPSIGSVV